VWGGWHRNVPSSRPKGWWCFEASISYHFHKPQAIVLLGPQNQVLLGTSKRQGWLGFSLRCGGGHVGPRHSVPNQVFDANILNELHQHWLF
jgi:hypothetical protein